MCFRMAAGDAQVASAAPSRASSSFPWHKHRGVWATHWGQILQDGEGSCTALS